MLSPRQISTVWGTLKNACKAMLNSDMKARNQYLEAENARLAKEVEKLEEVISSRWDSDLRIEKEVRGE